MAIEYTITRRSGPTVLDHVAFQRGGEHVKDELWRQVRAMIEGNGMLDRPIAYELRDKVEACDTSKPDHGYARFEAFRMPSPMLGSVEFSAIRRYGRKGYGNAS